MKLKNKYRKLFAGVIIFVLIFANTSISICAHNAALDLSYDICDADDSGDGIDETWYCLLQNNYGVFHLDNAVDTIKYYFEETTIDGTYCWTTEVSESDAQNTKNAFANSMKKWNNVYFYDYGDSGVLVKRKIINIVEGTESDHNLSIYPRSTIDGTVASASARFLTQFDDLNAQYHAHSSDWAIYVSVHHFYYSYFTSQEDLSYNFEQVGAHEIGHILGLGDMDVFCDVQTKKKYHHQELLMGYKGELDNGTVDITYKDIAGVAITRGFHTDDDHKWLNCGLQDDETYKLVCSICNGVKNVGSLNGYNYNTYGFCGNDHYLYGGNMMPVASYGTKDYYKCKYCRYVAPFSSNVAQNYIKTYINETQHECMNNVTGLEYTFYENHVIDTYTYIDNSTHKYSCGCGMGAEAQPHVIEASSIIGIGKFAKCIECGYLVDLRDDYFNSILSITKISINGSYILSSGAIVLVDQDIQAYLKGTLVFYHPSDVPTVQ